nr:trihelix transcription factor GT-2-like [Ipomoea batatas]
MLGVSGLISAAADGAATATAPPGEAPESGGAGSAAGGPESGAAAGGYGEEDKAEAERNSGGNRWPRQETLALLKIRSDMDVVFRDSSLKGPLWEEVSRKMAELGYHRSSKKCKEKFENVYKYHKRTKDGRASKADGKTYRFFDQLEAFEHTTPSHALPPPPRPQPPPLPPAAVSPMVAPPLPGNNNNNNASTTNVIVAANPPVPVPAQVTVPSTQNPFGAGVHNPINAPAFPPSSQTRSLSLPPPQAAANTGGFPSQRNVPGSPLSDSTSSSTSSDEDIQRRHRRKRKWKDFFERLMKDVIEKQEDLQKKFLEALEKRERDRMVREEAWRVQEMARMNREHDLLVQERSMAAAKDAAVLQFLQKVSEQHNLQIPITNATPAAAQIQIQLPESLSTPTQQPQPPPPPIPPHSQQPPPQGPEPISVAPPATMPFTISTPTPPVPTKILDVSKPPDNNAIESFTPASSSRWPKTEVQALIRLRTNLDTKYQENGPKGPLWEEISAGMRKLGYNRNAKRCKEKWENINKYFKKVKESNKKRPEDSKTCPYFHLLDAIYKERAKNEATFNPPGSALKPENNPMVPIMVQPEQQWPLPPDLHHHHALNDHESDNIDDDEGDEDDEDEDDEGGGAYEIVTNKPPSTTTTTTTTTATSTV